MNTLPPPAWLRTFETAARLGGFATAAKALGLTPAAVSQQVRALEGRLGFTLFNRLSRGVELSEMGRAYLPSVRRAFEDLEAATAGLFGVGQPRTLIVRAPISFAALRLAPLLGEFHALHPRIPVRLCTAVWADGVDEATIDLDIRYGGGGWPAHEVLCLTEPVSVPVCPAGSVTDGNPASILTGLLTSTPIHVTGYENLWAALARAHRLDETPIESMISADSSLVALEMVTAGVGPAIIARDLADAHIASGRVAAVPGLTLEHGHAHYLVLPARPAPPRPEAILFRNWLCQRTGPAASRSTG